MRHVDFLVHELTPYRVQFLRRLSREVPHVSFRALVTTEFAGFNWRFEPPVGVNVVLLGHGEHIADQGKLRRWPGEWRKGGRIIDHLSERGTAAVVMTSYRDAGHLRALQWCDDRGIPAYLWADSSIRGERAAGASMAVKRALLPHVLRRFAGALPWGTLGREYFLRYGVPDDRIVIVPPEPDYRAIAGVNDVDIAKARQHYGLASDRRHLLFSGRVSGEKRIDLLLSAFADAVGHRPTWDLVVAGDGPESARLRAQVPSTLRPRVHWLGAVLDPATLASVSAACDVFVLPSDFEPWGVVVNEAAAAGLALVCSTAVGAAQDLLRDGVNGVRFAQGSREALCDAILHLTGLDGERLSAMRRASRELIADWRLRHDPVAALGRAMSPLLDVPC